MSDKPPTPKKVRRSLVLMAALIIIAVIGAVSALFWARYTESPRRSLAQLTSAVESKDWDGVQRYMDVDAVASNYMGALLTNANGNEAADEATATLGREGVKDNDTGMGGSGAAAGLTMNPVFTQRFRDSLHKSVESGELKSEAGGLSSILLGTKPNGVDYESKKKASVTVEVPAVAGGTQIVTLRMQWAEDHWRIIALENLDDLMGPLN